MAAAVVEARPELVGKRFLCVSGEAPPELAEIARWSWRVGVIRAVSHRDPDNPELTPEELIWNFCLLLQSPVLVRLFPRGPETGGLLRVRAKRGRPAVVQHRECRAGSTGIRENEITESDIRFRSYPYSVLKER
ncbi:putative JmjC domain-containing histone demethylation protein 2C isoform X2, partial [Clarias magur]